MKWVQGMRRQDDAKTHRNSWMEVLFRRLRGDFAELDSGTKTLVAEQALGLAPNAYFYLDACVPNFGFIAVAHDRHLKTARPMTSVSPFDTGGLAHGRIQLKRPLSAADRVRLVVENSYTPPAHAMPFTRWLKAAYDSRVDYIIGKRPKVGAVDVVDLRGSQRRSWLWEGRVLKLNYGAPPLRPVRIFMKPGDRMRYLNWLRGERLLSARDSRRHMRMVHSLTREVVSPAGEMRQFLSRRW